MDGSGIVSRRRDPQWKIKLIKFISGLSWRTDKFPTIYWFAQLWQEGSHSREVERKLCFKLGSLNLEQDWGYLPQENSEHKPKGLPHPSAGVCLCAPFCGRPPSNSTRIFCLNIALLSPSHRIANQDLCAVTVPSVWLGQLKLKGLMHSWVCAPSLASRHS